MPKSGQLGNITQSGMFAGGMSPTPATSSLAFSAITGAPSTNALLNTALNAKLTAVKGAAVVDATDAATAISQLNLLLASLRAAGIILP